MRPPRGSGLRFQRLRLENWKNFTRVDIPLESRVFLAGPNAAGKSNLLDALRFLHDLVRPGGGLAEAAGARHGIGKLRCLAARQSSDVAIAAQIGTAEEPGLWEYELHLSEGERRRAVITRERAARGGEDLWQRPDADDERDPERLTQTYLEQINVNREVREIADLFRSIRYLHPAPQLVRDPDRYAPRRDDPYGGDFLERVAQAPQNIRTARLHRILEVLQAAMPQLQELEFYRDEVRGTPHLRGKYRHWRPQGAWQNEDQFSDGTLRLLGILWAALEDSGPLLVEEPEVGLHAGVVALIPKMLAAMLHRTGRQVLLTTHAEALLRDEGIALNEVLVLIPEAEGTAVRAADSLRQVADLLDSGVGLTDGTAPDAGSPEEKQMPLFHARQEETEDASPADAPLA